MSNTTTPADISDRLTFDVDADATPADFDAALARFLLRAVRQLENGNESVIGRHRSKAAAQRSCQADVITKEGK